MGKRKKRVFPSKTLERYHARLVGLKKDQMLFQDGDPATDYMQVESGTVKMFIVSNEGQEFIQGIFNAGESFGEPALIGKFPYPSSVVAIEPSKVWKLPADYFFQMLRENFELHLKMDQVLCQRLRYSQWCYPKFQAMNPSIGFCPCSNISNLKIPRLETARSSSPTRGNNWRT